MNNHFPQRISSLVLQFAVTLLVHLSFVAAASAQTLQFTDDSLLVVASASPDSSFIGGVGNTALTIDQDSGDFGGPGISHGLLRFNDFSLPPGAIVNSATLNIQTVSATNGPVNVYRMTTDWNESTTWNSLGGDGFTPGVESVATPSDSLVDVVEEPTRFDVTSIVNDWINGESNFGFGLFNESGDGWDVRTVDLEEESAPTLTVELEIPPPVRLQVDTATGLARFISQADLIDFELRSYQILSAAGDLQSNAWETANLSARGVDAIDVSSPGERWDVVLSSSEALMEAYLLGGSPMTPGELLPIGQILDGLPEAGPFPSLEIEVATSNFLGGSDPTITFSGVAVDFVSFGNGDFDSDADVDGTDFLAWQRGQSPSPLSPTDLTLWQTTYGETAGGGAAAIVPEPATATTLCLCVAMCCVAATRRRN